MNCGNCRAIVIGLIVTSLSAGCLNSRKQTYDPVLAQVQPEGDAPSKLELPTKKGAEACLATAQMMDKNGQAPEAVGYYEKARSMNPEYSHVCRRLAVLYDKYGNFAKADEEYAKALALFPKDPALLNDVGNCHRVRGNWTLAEDYLRQAVELQPENKRAWNNLGMTLVMRDRLDLAMEAFGHAVPEAQAHCNVAACYLMQGKRAEAIREYRSALEMAPDLERARAALVQLENPNLGKQAGSKLPLTTVDASANENNLAAGKSGPEAFATERNDRK